MADRYWVGGTGNWDGLVDTKWSATSGGAGGASVPTASDNVFFDANSGTGTVTIVGTRPCLSFDTTGFAGTVAGSSTPVLQVNASLTLGAATTFASSLAKVVFLGNTASRTWTSNGKTLENVQINMTSSNTVTLQDNADVVLVEQFLGGLALGANTLSCSRFLIESTGTRTLNFGTGKIFLNRNITATCWSSVSNSTVTLAGTPLIEVSAPGTGVTKTISTATASTMDQSLNFSIVAGSTGGTISFGSAGGRIGDLTFGNFAYTVSNQTMSLYGNLTISGSSPTFTAGTLVWTFAAGTSTKTITTSGVTIDWPWTFLSSGNTDWQLQDALTLGNTRTLTFTQGTLSLGAYTLSTGIFSSSGSSARTIAFGTGKIVLTRTATATVWTTATVTNLTTTGSKTVEVTAPGSAVTKTLSFGAGTSAQVVDISVVAGSTTGSITMSGSVRDLTFGDFNYTFNSSTVTLFGNFLNSGTSPTFTSGSQFTMAATSGTKTITSSGETIPASWIFNGIGGTFELNDALTSAASLTATLTNGTLNLQSYTFTIGSFVSSSSNSRTINFGTGKIVLTATGSTTVLNMATSTNFVATGTKLIEFPLNGSGTKTFAGGTGSTEANKLNVSVVSGTSGTTFSFTNDFNDITFENVSCTISPVSAATIYGNLTIGGTNVSWTSAAVTWTFGSTSGTKTIQTNGVTVGSNFTFNGSGGSWQLQSALTLASARSCVLTTGAIDLNDYTLTTGIFELTNNSNVRSIDFGTGKITVTTTAGTATYGLRIQNRTNFSVAGNYEFLVTGSMIVFISGTEAQSPHLTVSGSTIYIENSFVNNFSALGFNDIRTNSSTSNALTIYGNFSVQQSVFNARNYPPPVALVMTFAATSGTKTITSNGAQINTTMRFDGAGGTWQFADNFTQQLQTTSGENECYITLTRGTIDINGKSVTTNAFVSTNSNTRGLNFGTGGDLKILGYDSVWFYAWNVSGSGLSISETNSFISFDSGSDKTMNVGGGSAVYPTIRNNTGSPLRIYTSNYGNVTFKNLAVGSVTTRFEFQSSYTFYFTNFGVIPPVGVNAQIYSISSGSQATLSQSSGIIDCQRLQIKDSNATGGASWYAGTTSVDQGNNTGWIFQNAPQASGNMLMLFA